MGLGRPLVEGGVTPQVRYGVNPHELKDLFKSTFHRAGGGRM
ncbi:MAG: hypothetical protein QW057_05280 [Candidatus Bathyarchaeia archaeon]